MLDRVRRLAKRAGRHRSPEQTPKRADTHGIELVHWRLDDGRQNFGDHLSSALVTKLAASQDRFLDEVVAPRRLLAVGSILHFARSGDVVWGSGVNGSVRPDKHAFGRLDVRSVRGPLTRRFLEQRGIAVPPIYGDPALLTKRLLGGRFAGLETCNAVGYVPNFADLPIMESWENCISPLLPWPEVVKRILQCELIISSSLHGLVIADSFGKPCIYLRVSEIENMFKYEDYCLGAGRGDLKVTHSREQAVRASPLCPAAPDLAGIERAFPWDLWP